jgi:protein SCO1
LARFSEVFSLLSLMRTFWTRKIVSLLTLAAALAAPAAVSAHEEGTEGAAEGQVGIYENFGGQVPLDAGFRDENGAPVSLRQLMHAPTILALVYYKCPNVCDFLLTGLAGSLKTLDATPGKDFSVITISIDENETPADARRARRIALESIEKPFPPAAWRFLTGAQSSITAVAQAVGFRYIRTATGFDHPVGIVVLSSTGKIIRYMEGADFLSADLKLSLLEASQGRVGPTIARVLRFCFTTDPKSHKLAFNLMRIVGTVTLLAACALVTYLIIASRKRRGRNAA